MRTFTGSFLLFTNSALAAPSFHNLITRHNTTNGPCDAWAPACQPVRQSNACLAQFLNRAEDGVILRCVNDQNAVQAKIDVSEPWIRDRSPMQKYGDVLTRYR
jgi:hypothetical protein